MSSLQELAALGEKLGFKAEALQAFVKEQQEIARQERSRQREEKEKDQELQKAK
jgi:hypothetical protein